VKAVCAICEARIQLLPQGYQTGDPLYCTEHELLRGRDPRVVIPAAINAAEDDMHQHSDGLVRWCLPELHDLLGFLLPGTVTYGCAFPKNGKTAFLSNNIAYWVREGVRPWIMPTESRPKGLVTRIACERAGVSAEETLSRRLRLRMDQGDTVAEAQWNLVLNEYNAIRRELAAHGADFAIEPAPRLTRRIFRDSCQAAKADGFGIVVVDHVDHIKADNADGLSGYQASEAVQHDALEFAELFEMPVLLMSQLNTSRVTNDPLHRYKRPVPDWVWMKGVKDQIATGMFGIFRPMVPNPDDRLLADIRSGQKESWHIALPNTMGLADMLSRFGGAKADRVLYLPYHDGRITSPTTAERFALEQQQHGIRTHYGEAA
jgi:hypothetical protein